MLETMNFLSIEMALYRLIQNATNNEQNNAPVKLRFKKLELLLPIVSLIFCLKAIFDLYFWVGTRHFLDSPFVLPEIRKYLLTDPNIHVDNKQLFTQLNAFYSKMDRSLFSNYLCIGYFHSQVEFVGFDHREQMNPHAIMIIEPMYIKYKNVDKIETLNANFPLIFDHLFINNCVDLKALNEVRKMAEQIRVSCVSKTNLGKFV
jgi:hypothetical protein